jgi:hypothetical protein
MCAAGAVPILLPKKAAFYPAPAERLAPVARIRCPREFRAAPLAHHDGGLHE